MITGRRGRLSWPRSIVGIGVVFAVTFLIGAKGLEGAQHTVSVTIVAGETAADGGFNYNGYARGQMTVTVPLNWKVAVVFRNASAVPHSLEVLPYTARSRPSLQQRPPSPAPPPRTS